MKRKMKKYYRGVVCRSHLVIATTLCLTKTIAGLIIGSGNTIRTTKETIRSAPFAIFQRQDLLQLALDLNVPVPAVYGEIRKDENGLLYTTGEQRTGCSMCGFGIQLVKRPHRFDRLRQRSPKEWDYWMNRCCEDENGEKYGWGRVLDYIGVEWRDIPIEYAQMKLDLD